MDLNYFYRLYPLTFYSSDAPRLGRRTDPVTGAIMLYVENADKERFQKFQACQKLERDGKCLKVEWVRLQNNFVHNLFICLVL